MATGQKITHLDVSTSKAEEDYLQKQLFQKINVDLNDGIKEAKNQVFLWYKKDPNAKPITRIQFSFNIEMKTGLVDAEFTQINKDLNIGVSGDYIFLWYFCGTTQNDYPITSLNVTTNAKDEPALLLSGWERLGCDLNRNAGGSYIYLWVKREQQTYICEVSASVDFYADTHMFNLGFTRVDENTNRGNSGNNVFIWYLLTTDKRKALAALDVSTSSQEETVLKAKGFKRVSVNLNAGTTGNATYLWYMKPTCEPQINSMVLLVNSQAWSLYSKAGVILINKNLNNGNKGREMYLEYK